MAQTEVVLGPAAITADEVVAYSLRRARRLRGWTQAEAAERLAPFLERPWSRIGYSNAERARKGVRVKTFSASELHALSAGFGLPIGYFLIPPPVTPDVTVRHGSGREECADAFVGRVFEKGVDVESRLRERELFRERDGGTR